MTASLINGRALAEDILDNVAVQVTALGTSLQLAAVCVGEDPGLKSFVAIKNKAAQSVGIQLSSYFFRADQKKEAEDTLRFLAGDDLTGGIFIELPLPADWEQGKFLSLIPPGKDVDAITPAIEKEFENGESPVLPPAVKALEYVAQQYDIDLRSVRAAVIGQGKLVGAPIARWLRRVGAAVDVLDVGSPDPAQVAAKADLVISGVGQPGLVTGDWIKPGATVIDFGYGRKGGKYAGDVDTDSVMKKAGLLTPVPGGMGPLVVAAVMENLLTLATF